MPPGPDQAGRDAEPEDELDPVERVRAAWLERTRHPATPAEPSRRVRTSREILWRDSATILIGLTLVLLIVQLVGPGAGESAVGAPTMSAGPAATSPPTGTAAAATTIGPVVAPGGTPSASPVLTQPPTGSQPPTANPGLTPRPTRRPPPPPPVTPPPVTPPPPSITPPTPAPTPAPVSCDAPVATTVTCSSASENSVPGSEAWDMGGTGVLVAGGNGSTTITWTYSGPGTYTVRVTVTGLDGSTTSATTEVQIL